MKEQEAAKRTSMRIWQGYCLGDKANDSRDGKNMGFYLKIWLENMHKKWKSYK